MLGAVELFKALMRVPELSTVGSPEERGAFSGLRIDGRTVREVGRAIGVSKSHVANLADRFQAKLIKRMAELRRKPAASYSTEFQNVCQGFRARLSGITSFDDDWTDHKIGNFRPGATSREDWAECTGEPLLFEDE